ncbi:signal peptidase I SipW [Bacillus suaedaesalsae]|uniref:Signal peptidase I n=1 Tax=Bacillus suaedaesalsae TaxID=2810349 RepID=A0ABS2DKM8_9BACI|nr:signal peptidase I [Bacillus suaedaesalsae]MBM6619059.1 signal peptidase I [Bacillus suaedaesalsae]
MTAKKILKITSNVTTGILFVLLIFMIFLVISSKASGGEPKVFGYELKTVLSGSMEPTFKTGSIIAIKPVDDTSKLKKDDVITFLQSDGNVVTHRITDKFAQGEQVMFQTKGDNNEDLDSQPILSQNVIGKYTGFTIPFIGYFIDFAKSSKGTAILLIIPGVLLLAYSVVSIMSALRELDPKKTDSQAEKTA